MRPTTKLIIANALITLVIVMILGLVVLNRFYNEELADEHADLEQCIKTFRMVLEQKGTEFRVVDRQLLIGDQVLNNNNLVPDQIQQIFGGYATIFMGDTRVATNLLDKQGRRAVGTRLSGPPHTAIFMEGRGFRGEADILGQQYLTAYEPIRDKSGSIIGVLFVGVKKETLLQHFQQIRSPIIVTLAVLAVSLAIVTFLLLKIIRRLESVEANSSNFLRTLMDTIPSPIFYKDAQGRYLGFNRTYEEYVGMSQEQLIGRTPAELWPEDLARKYQQQDQALFDKPGIQKYEGTIETADGTRHEVIFQKATFCAQNGEVAGLVGIILDITERKLAEEETQRAYQQLHDIIEFLPDATFVVDKEKRVIAWNRAIESMTGFGKEEMLGEGEYAYAVPFYGCRRPILIDVLDGDLETVEERYPYVRRVGNTVITEVKIPGLWGRDSVYLWGTAAPLFDRHGNRVGGIESIRDITEYKLAEAEIRFRNLLLSTQLNASTDGILAVDQSGRVVSWNRQFMNIFKIPQSLLELGDDEPVLQTVIEQAEDPELFLQRVRQIYQNRKQTSKDEFRLKSGVIIDRYSAPMVDEDGRYYGRVWYFRDITEARATKEAIESAYQQVLDIIEFLPDATFVLDKEKRVIAWNRAMEEMSGVSKEEMLGKGDYTYGTPFYGSPRPTLIDMLDTDDAELMSHYDYIQQTGRTLFAQVNLPAIGGGESRYVSTTASPLFDKHGNRVGSIQSIRDLTENRRVSIEKAHLKVELRHSQMMQSVMVQLGHDLKTPLTPLITLLPIIGEKLSDPQLSRMIDICRENADQIRLLTDKSLNFAALSALAPANKLEDIELAAAVELLLESRFGDVDCEVLISPEIKVEADRIQFNEVLGNLISNAERYASKKIKIWAAETHHKVTVAVQDDGIGLAAENLERIFDEFFKVDESRHDLTSVGLGLSICKRIVLNHHGKIWAESPGLGQGTTISFSLPRNSIEYSI